MGVVCKTHFQVTGPLLTDDLTDALRRGLEYDKRDCVMVGVRKRDVDGGGSQSVQGLGSDIVEFDGGLAGTMAGCLDVPPEYAATHPRAERFQSGFFDGEPSR